MNKYANFSFIFKIVNTCIINRTYDIIIAFSKTCVTIAILESCNVVWLYFVHQNHSSASVLIWANQHFCISSVFRRFNVGWCFLTGLVLKNSIVAFGIGFSTWCNSTAMSICLLNCVSVIHRCLFWSNTCILLPLFFVAVWVCAFDKQSVCLLITEKGNSILERVVHRSYVTAFLCDLI